MTALAPVSDVEDRRATDRQYANRRNRLIAYGRWQPYVDAEPVRQHLCDLQRTLSFQQVADLAGVSRTVVRRIVNGQPTRGFPPQQRVRTPVARRILAVQAGPPPVVGARRRLQALAVLGWSLRQLASHLGVTAQTVASIASGRRTTILPSTARAIAHLYDELWDVAPPETTRNERISVSFARRHAARNGWVSPLAWDDTAIDDPAARPDTTGRRRR